MTVIGRCAARSRAEAIQLLVMEVVHKPFQAFRTPTYLKLYLVRQRLPGPINFLNVDLCTAEGIKSKLICTVHLQMKETCLLLQFLASTRAEL
jgi:hypothetical protein